MSTKDLVWEDKYSVGVAEIDNQHKNLVAITNELFEAINSGITVEKINTIINSLVAFKAEHFATEEKYFKEFNYELTEEHILEHKRFNDTVVSLGKEYSHDVIAFAFKLVDFIEDWLIKHMMTDDQKYKQCFKDHGLK